MRIISGLKKGYKIITKKKQIARPISDKNRETIFNLLIHGKEINELNFSLENSNVLDLFAGTGSFSFEALSRGAAHATLIENDSDMVDIIYENIDKLEFQSKTTVHHKDCMKFQSINFDKKFNLIYVDPPYKKELEKKLLERIFMNNNFEINSIFLIEQAIKTPIVYNNNLELLRIKEIGNTQFVFYKNINYP